jgi:phenylacetate-CoA ligase
MTPRWFSRIVWRRYIGRNARSWRELEDFGSWDPQRQKKDLAARLLTQIRYFGQREDALREWKEAARVRTPEELWAIWSGLPILSKRDLQTRFPAREMGSRFGLRGAVGSTGGSTGEPVHYFHDSGMLRSSMAAAIYTQIRMGWVPGMPLVIPWGSERDIGRQVSFRSRLYDALRNEHLLDSYRMSDETVDRAVSICERRQPVAIYGFTSILEHLARRVVERGIAVPPGCVRVAWNGGEMLYAEQSELFRRAFGVGILNRYGGRELGAMACQFREGGPLEALRPWVLLEVVDEEGKQVGPGESGRLIWTSTVCRGTPFLRYDIGDLGSYRPADASEAGIGALARLEGRASGLLTLPDGRRINNIYWNHFFKEIEEVKQFQVELRADGSILIRLAGGGFSPERDREVRCLLRHFLTTVPLELVWVDAIPKTAQGKLVQVIRQGN